MLSYWLFHSVTRPSVTGSHLVNIKESIYSYALRNKTFIQTINFTQSIQVSRVGTLPPQAKLYGYAINITNACFNYLLWNIILTRTIKQREADMRVRFLGEHGIKIMGVRWTECLMATVVNTLVHLTIELDFQFRSKILERYPMAPNLRASLASGA